MLKGEEGTGSCHDNLFHKKPHSGIIDEGQMKMSIVPSEDSFYIDSLSKQFIARIAEIKNEC